ncbi:Zn-ribbon domain-containing OB-fold protein [Aeromicrobium wangtongii]|uniref:Zn-ribbon domain-containing OB-fold protein n=1 Tax=Aeromicrobium wangtongii TaxID=2969247 RepID=UPI0020175C43|nr:OB-fold domain-containing protein [Aeromicrobium wangtongii]MCL3819621.1 OB-fold domain-containing protein [Aeromicrobium wangtongii]
MNLPDVPPADDVTADWWDATREHRLTVQACTACDHVQHPPRAVCTACSSMDHLTLRDASGAGVVDASTVVHRAPRPDVEVPYTVARVRLAEGPILLTRLTGGNDWTIGDAVAVGWVDLPDGRALPVFHRTDG